MPSYTKQYGDVIMSVTSVHVLDAELAKRVGIVGPYDFVNHGLRGYTEPDHFPITFRPSLCASDALMVAAEYDMRIEFRSSFADRQNGFVEIEWCGDSLRVDHNDERSDKLRAMCAAVMEMASRITEIPR